LSTGRPRQPRTAAPPRGGAGATPPIPPGTGARPGGGSSGARRGGAAATGPFPIGPALAFMRDLRTALDAGAGPLPALASAAAGLPRDLREGVEAATRRLAGSYSEDEWGFDEELAESVYPLLEAMYDRWWRVQATGVSNVPAHGRALLVANHAGILPWDATMMGVALLREHPLPRYPRFLVLNWAFELPWVGATIRKLGGTPASPYNAMRLLEQEKLVAVFPEGVKGTSKDFKDRYRLQRFGRGGFVELALRTRAPIVPVAVVGSEEIYPKLGELPLLARLTGAPFFPVTPTFPLLGPLGAVPLPSRWRIEFCNPIDVSAYGPDAAEDRALVFELSERVRDTIQQKLYENLVKRGSAFV
jgi:1-acyl-sn-glycerol-3-phosphate acyltransferase